MSKLNEIQSAILRLDGGQFQKIVDTYIYKKFGYSCIMDYGSHSGTNKTTRGVPDTYFPLVNGKYIFIMYGSHEKSVYKKIKNDIQDCLNTSKTGIETSGIQQIICCHTSSNISPKQDIELRKICSNKGILLDIVGIGTISQDLLNYYPIIAKNELNINVDSGQILTIDDFIKLYDENPMVTPIDIGIHGRDKEIDELLGKIFDSKVTMVYGNSGVGKTKLIVEACKIYCSKNEGTICYCIKNNGLSLYEDLKAFIEINKKYLIFIDDANQTSDLSHIIEYVNKENYKVKIIASVRDYAKEHTEKIVKKFVIPVMYNVNPMTNEQIADIIEKELNITNSFHIERINQISKGNPRLAIQAGRISKEKSLKDIMNAEQLYESYYGKIIEDLDIFNHGIAMRIAGLTAFFNSINLEDKELESIILDFSGCSRSEFDDVVIRLHTMEIVDLFESSAIKVSEQSMANYFLYYVFATKRLISLSSIIKRCFPAYKQKIIYAVNTITKLFYSEEVSEYLTSEISLVWDEYAVRSKTCFIEFIKMFYSVRELETLKYIDDFVNQLDMVSYNVDEIKFNQLNNNHSIEDTYLNILGGFRYSRNRRAALELIIKYYKRRPDMFMDFYFCIVDGFGIDRRSYYNNYIVQQEVIEILISETERFNDHNVNMLFIRVAEAYLKLIYHTSEDNGGRSITVYTIPMYCTDGSKRYREDIWNALSKLYINLHYKDIITNIIENYRYGAVECDSDIINFDLENIYAFIRCNLSKDNFKHCRIVDKISKLTAEISYDIKDFLNNRTLEIYRLLKGSRHLGEVDYNRERELKKIDIKNNFSSYSYDDIVDLFNCFREINFDNTRETWGLNEGVQILFDVFSDKEDIYVDIIKVFIEMDTPLNPYPFKIVCALIKAIGYNDTYQLISSNSYNQKQKWLNSYFACLNNEQINKINLERLNGFLFNDEIIKTASVPEMEELEKFRVLDDNIIIKVTKFLMEKNEIYPGILAQFMRFGFYENKADFNKLVENYSCNLDVLKKAYFLSLKFDKNIDYNAWFLKNMIHVEHKFLKDFIEFTVGNNESRNGHLPSLSVIWGIDDWIKLAWYAVEEYINLCGCHYWNVRDHLSRLFGFKGFYDYDEDDAKNIESNAFDRRQDIWIQDFIDKYYFDKERIKLIFDVISHFIDKRRVELIRYFINKNDSFDLFKELSLEPNSWSAWGSFVPVYERRKSFLESLLPLFNGLRFIKHRNYVEKMIEGYRKEIKKELRSEFLDER